MVTYICTQCTGRSGEEQTFDLDKEPRACPYNGCSSHHLKEFESYLSEQVERLEKELEEAEKNIGSNH